MSYLPCLGLCNSYQEMRVNYHFIFSCTFLGEQWRNEEQYMAFVTCSAITFGLYKIGGKVVSCPVLHTVGGKRAVERGTSSKKLVGSIE